MSEDRTDAELLQSWVDGDQPAGNQLLRRHFRTVYRFFRSKVQDSAEDLVQQTMMACAEGAERYRGESSFRTFLLGIARHQLLMHLRRHERKGKRIDHLEASIADVLGSPSLALAAKDGRELVLAGLRHIPIDLQIALEMYYWEDLKVSEIADAMEIPIGTVKSRLHRGRQLLREWITSDPKFDRTIRDASLSTIDGWKDA